MDIKLGQQIGIYRLDALLGEGGMGAVYQAFDLNLQRKVALKVMQENLARNETFRARFLQEARAAAQLDHPSIIRILHFESLPELLYLVMAYVGGPNLRNYVSHRVAGNQPLPLAEILNLTAQVADALGYAHQQGIVHRDIKPDNLLLQPTTTQAGDHVGDLRVIVTDFGLAKLQAGGIQTQTGTFMGTLPYMSPEQCQGVELDGRSDLYSLGVVLYQLVTGRLPFNVKSPTEALHHHVSVTPPMPQLVRPGLPQVINDLLLTSLAKEPENRFANGEAMAASLRAAALEVVDFDEGSVTPLPQMATPIPGDMPTQTAPPELNQSMQAVRSDVIADPDRSDHLLIARPGKSTRAIPLLRDKVLIGRGPQCDIRPDDGLLSAEHVRLQRVEDGWQVVDLNSKNGTFLRGSRLLAGVPEPWGVGQTLRIGEVSLQWRQARQPLSTAGVMSQVGHVEGSIVRTTIGEIGLRIDPAHISLGRGEQVTVQVAIKNLGQLVTRYELTQAGLPPSWVRVSEESVQLMPGAEAHVAVIVAVPADEQHVGGQKPFQIDVRAGRSRAQLDCLLEVKGETGMHIDMQPTQLAVGQTGRIALQNSGNVPTTYKLRGRDAADALDFKFSHSDVTLQPGEKKLVSVSAGIKKRPYFGARRMVPFAVQVFAADAPSEAKQISGVTEINPLIPSWLVPLLGIALFFVCSLASWGAYLVATRPEVTPVAVVGVTEVPSQTPIVDDTGVAPADPTATIRPTNTPQATPTTGPTNTPEPTATLIPTNTPSPTATRPPAGASGLGSGLDERVRAVAGADNLIYVGGDFGNGIKQWNQLTQQWSDLGGGVQGQVYDIAVFEGEVYITGRFTTVVNGDGSEVDARNVAVWNGSSWRALGGGVSANPVSRAIAVDDEGTVYVGGSFNSPGRNIARWTVSDQAWHRLGIDDDLDGGVRYFGNDASGGDYVSDIVIDGDTVYVSGQFSVASEDLNNINVPRTTNLAAWDRVTGRWSAVGGGLVSNVNYGTEIWALAFYDGVLYVGGRFDTIINDEVNMPTNYLAAWDGEAWQSFENLGNFVFAITVNEDGIYVGGEVSQYNDGGEAAGNIAYWDGSEWQVVSTGANEQVDVLYTDGTYVYIGGDFTQFAGSGYAYVASWVAP